MKQVELKKHSTEKLCAKFKIKVTVYVHALTRANVFDTLNR